MFLKNRFGKFVSGALFRKGLPGFNSLKIRLLFPNICMQYKEEIFYRMRRFFLVTIALWMAVSAHSQKTGDIGIWGGGAGYQGDLENVPLMRLSFPSAGAFFRYNFNYRVGVRAMFLFGRSEASGIIQNHQWEYGKFVQDLSVQAEINFLRYMIGNKNAAFSSFVTAGLGVMYYPYRYDPVFMQTINPETNKGDAVIEKSVFAPTIPFGIGVKFNVGKRLGFGIEYQMRKILDDRLDDLDDPLAYIRDEVEVTYHDRIHNNDWIGFLGVFVTIKLDLGNKSCPAYDAKK